MNQPMNHAIRRRIKIAIKNGVDISDLIKDYSLKGEDLRGAVIKTFNRVSDDMSGANFSKAIIGEPGKITNVSGSKMKNCRFDDVTFIGTVFMRRCDCRDSNFSGAQLQQMEYQNSDFRGCKFCETAIRFGSNYSLGSRFSQDMFEDLGKMWNLDIKIRSDNAD